jgi:small nuclear ribonucleoprotein (snRNP)-like protein
MSTVGEPAEHSDKLVSSSTTSTTAATTLVSISSSCSITTATVAAAELDTDMLLASSASPLDKIGKLLGCKLRVRVVDGRLLEGELQCLDREMNLILIDALEYYYSSTDADAKLDTSKCRGLGMALVPGNQVISIHLKT